MNAERVFVLSCAVVVALAMIANVYYHRNMTWRSAAPIVVCVGLSAAIQIFMGEKYIGSLNSLSLVLVIVGLTFHLKNISERVSKKLREKQMGGWTPNGKET